MKTYYLVITATQENYGVAHHDAYCHSLELAQSYLAEQTYPCVSKEIIEIDITHVHPSFMEQLEYSAEHNRPLHKRGYQVHYNDVAGVERIATVHSEHAA